MDNVDDGSDTGTEDDTNDEARGAVKKARELHQRPMEQSLISSVKGAINISSQSTTNDDVEEVRTSRNFHDDPEEVDLWDSDEDHYEKFKKRKSLKRKRVAAGARKDEAVANQTSKPQNGARTKGSERQKKEKQWGDASNDDQLMEYTLPSYLQERRTGFDHRYEKMNASGLKLPPTYEEVYFSDDERLQYLEEKPDFPRGAPSAPYEDKQLPKSLGLIPASIAQWLRDYQVEGTSFLHQLFVYQNGGILGDDMGLGKTVQVIAFLTAAFGKTGDERDKKRMRKMRRAGASWYPRIIVVCPGTLIENWKNEFQRWGWWHVDVYHGVNKEEVLQAARAGSIEIMLTTYSTYRINKSAINVINWDCCVADECHQIKGKSSEITQAMNEINALCRIGLTGTAIQNSYDELWTLLNWTNPGKLGPISTWKSSISIPLKDGQSHDATMAQLAKARQVAKKLVTNVLPHMFLRRMKTLIAHQLPKKSDRVVFCSMTATQNDAYENLIESEAVRYIKAAIQDCHCGSGKRGGWCCMERLEDGTHWRAHVFPYITHLMKICNHLAVLIPQSNDAQEQQSKNLAVLETAMPGDWRHLYKTRESIMNFVNPEFCGKWKVLDRLLRFWHDNGDKVLVFSHSVRLLKMLSKLFATTSYRVSYLDGSIKYEDRAKEVDDFNSDPDQFVFLISTKAGGVGLNITSANKVVIFDPSWNPAHDLQAQDRAYRIGQTRDVEVFRLICTGTIEEIIYARQIYKQQQANIGYTASHERRYFKGVQENSNQKGEIFGLQNMFTFQENRNVLKEIVNKTNVAESRAGVQIADIDLTDTQDSLDDKDAITSGKTSEDAFFKQLASQLVDEAEDIASQGGTTTGRDGAPPKKTKQQRVNSNSTGSQNKKADPIAAILSGTGVEYSHLNSEVVGSSRIETSLSRRAEENGNVTASLANEHVFAKDTQERHKSVANDDDNDDDDDDSVQEQDQIEDEDLDGGVGAMKIRWRYRPPDEVRARQLCQMARMFGDGDVVAFAQEVEGMTQEGRREVLDRYYRARRRELGIGLRKEEVDRLDDSKTGNHGFLEVNGREGLEKANSGEYGHEVMIQSETEPWEL